MYGGGCIDEILIFLLFHTKKIIINFFIRRAIKKQELKKELLEQDFTNTMNKVKKIMEWDHTEL